MPAESFAALALFVAVPWALLPGRVAVCNSIAPSRGRLSASTLRGFVQDAVTAVTAPLHHRIDTLSGVWVGETPDLGLPQRERLTDGLLSPRLDTAQRRRAPDR